MKDNYEFYNMFDVTELEKTRKENERRKKKEQKKQKATQRKKKIANGLMTGIAVGIPIAIAATPIVLVYFRWDQDINARKTEYHWQKFLMT